MLNLNRRNITKLRKTNSCKNYIKKLYIINKNGGSVLASSIPFAERRINSMDDNAGIGNESDNDDEK